MKYPFAKQLSQILLEKDSQPLLGDISFSWEDFSNHIAKELELENLEITSGSTKWELTENIHPSLEETMQVFAIQINPLTQYAFWIMDKKEINKFLATLIYRGSKEKSFISDILQESFSHFVLAQVLDTISQNALFANLSFTIQEAVEIPELILCKKIVMKIDNKTVCGTIAISSEMQNAWVQHIANFPKTYSQWPITLPASIQLGSLHLPLEQFQNLAIGDFLIFEEANYNFETLSGEGTLLVNHYPLFRIVIEGNQSTIASSLPKREESSMAEEEIVSLEETPVQLSVELARFSLPLKTLLEKEVGNFVELPTLSENVSLLVNGKKVAVGKLAYVGDTLCIRIESIFSS